MAVRDILLDTNAYAAFKRGLPDAVLLDNPFLWPLTGKNLSEGLAMIDKA